MQGAVLALVVRHQDTNIFSRSAEKKGSKVQGVLGLIELKELGFRRLVDSGRGDARAEYAQGTPTQSHISPSILVDENDRAGRVRVQGG